VGWVDHLTGVRSAGLSQVRALLDSHKALDIDLAGSTGWSTMCGSPCLRPAANVERRTHCAAAHIHFFIYRFCSLFWDYPLTRLSSSTQERRRDDSFLLFHALRIG
jgi:hypothetical protein